MKKTVLWSVVLGMFAFAPANVFASEGAPAEKFKGLSRVCSDALREAKADKTGDACSEALNALKDVDDGACKYKAKKGKNKGKGSTLEKYTEDFSAAVSKLCPAPEPTERSAENEEESPKPKKTGTKKGSGSKKTSSEEKSAESGDK